MAFSDVILNSLRKLTIVLGKPLLVATDEDNQTEIKKNELKLWSNRSDDDNKRYFLINQFNDGNSAELVIKDKDDNNITPRLKLDVDKNDITIDDKSIYRDIDSQMEEDGYAILKNGGLVMQWGHNISTSDDEETFDFPVSFPNKCFKVITQRVTANAKNIFPVVDNDVDGFTINRNGDTDGDHGFMWFAMGY